MSDRNVLKSYFNTGDAPSENQFADLIDSVVLSENLQFDINNYEPSNISEMIALQSLLDGKLVCVSRLCRW